VTPEGELKAKIDRWLSQQLDCYWFKPVQTGFGKRTLDYLICFRGRFVACEAKRKGGKAQGFQEELVRKIEAAGGNAFIFDDFDAFVAWMTHLKLEGA